MEKTKLTPFYDGSKLFRQGETGGPLFIIKEGKVELLVRSDKTGLESVVATVGPGAVLGVLSFLEGEKRNASGRAVGTVKAQVVNQEQRQKLRRNIPKWFGVLVKELATTLRDVTNELSDIQSLYGPAETKYDVIKRRHDKFSRELRSIKGEVKKSSL